jgi:ankyrin repeat protein
MDQKLLKILGGNTQHYPYALETKFPRIFASLMSHWDAPEGESYLNSLMVSERSDRSGFPPDVAAEIMHLGLIHAAQHHKKLRQDVWEPEARMFTHFDPLATQRIMPVWPTIPVDTLKMLHALGTPATQSGFFEATKTGNITALRLFLEAGVPVEIRNQEDWTALMSTAYGGHENIVSWLLRKGAEVNNVEQGGNTALHWAAFSGRLACCEVLVTNDAVIDARSTFGWTPLYQAVARNHVMVASYLLNNGADVNNYAKDGQTPLHKAAASGSLDMIKLLLRHHANARSTNQLGETPIVVAVKNRQDEAVTLLSTVS